MKFFGLLLLISLAVAGLVEAQDIPPLGTNCHRSCYTLDNKFAAPIKNGLFLACKAKATLQKTMRGNPKSGDRSIRNAYGCGSVIQYKFKNNVDLRAYQACEHALPQYIAQLRPYKKSLPPGVLRDFKC